MHKRCQDNAAKYGLRSPFPKPDRAAVHDAVLAQYKHVYLDFERALTKRAEQAGRDKEPS